MPDFWEHYRQQQEPEPVAPSNGPWWQRGTNLTPGPTQAQLDAEARARLTQPAHQPRSLGEGFAEMEERGISDLNKIGHLKQDDHCPSCGLDGYNPTGVTTASRCFFCGYNAGRVLNEDRGPAVVTGGVHSAPQIPVGVVKASAIG
jgi:hypothetical protein